MKITEKEFDVAHLNLRKGALGLISADTGYVVERYMIDAINNDIPIPEPYKSYIDGCLKYNDGENYEN